MAMPQPNGRLFAYYRRKPGFLGDDLSTDFLEPVYFHGVFEDIGKTAQGFGAALLANSQSHVVTYDLALRVCDCKKDDKIISVGRGADGRLIPDGSKYWNVSSAEVIMSSVRVASPVEEINQTLAPKRLEVQ